MRPTFDERDAAILLERKKAFNARQGPRVGDFVAFPCGTKRRISHMWEWNEVCSVQTSEPGMSFYLGNGFVQMSGSLYPAVPMNTLTDTGTVESGDVWFFHHNEQRGENGVYTAIDFRVFKCSVPAPE